MSRLATYLRRRNKNQGQALRDGKVRSIGCWNLAELEEKLRGAHVYSRGAREVQGRIQYFAFIYDRRVSQKALRPVVERRRTVYTDTPPEARA